MSEFEFRYPLLFRAGENDACAVIRTRKKSVFFESASKKQRDAGALGQRMAAALNRDEVMAELAESTAGLVAAVLELYFNDFEHDCDGGELCGHMLCHKCGCVVQKMIRARAAAAES